MLRTLLLAAAACLALPAAAVSQSTAAPPRGLHAFLLRADAPVRHVFPRTPAFAWQPVGRPGHYQFQLATARGFDESSLVYTDEKVASPAIAVPRELPWMTGRPYALWARVRFVGDDGGTTRWSAPFGFNLRWSAADVPKPLPAPPGLVRWTPVEGATAYDVTYTDISPRYVFETTTNVADEREFYTFHESGGVGEIHWRVRAIRYVDQAQPLANGLPRATYGPWSPVYTSVNPPVAAGTLAPSGTVSDSWDRAGDRARPHRLMPGFAWSGKPASIPGVAAGSPLYRVYVYTDDHCVNKVFTGAVVGGPAYAPRAWGGPMPLPQTTKELADWQGFRFVHQAEGGEGKTFDADGDAIVTDEDVSKYPAAEQPAAQPNPNVASDVKPRKPSRVDLWDSGWPSSRYYWTVVPVEIFEPKPPEQPGGSVPIEYHDVAVGQDACEAGRMLSFGKVSEPVLTQAAAPFASGLTPTGRMVAAVKPEPLFHDSPLVAWQPAVGAQSYEVEWSKTKYPWRAAGEATTPATSFVLPIRKPGTWWYRVRGVNPMLPPGAQTMSWSRPVGVRISGRVLKVVPSPRR